MSEYIIVVDKIESVNFYNIHVIESGSDNVLEFVKGKSFFDNAMTINKFIKQYNLKKKDYIVNNIYDNNKFLISSVSVTVKEYLHGSC